MTTTATCTTLSDAERQFITESQAGDLLAAGIDAETATAIGAGLLGELVGNLKLARELQSPDQSRDATLAEIKAVEAEDAAARARFAERSAAIQREREAASSARAAALFAQLDSLGSRESERRRAVEIRAAELAEAQRDRRPVATPLTAFAPMRVGWLLALNPPMATLLPTWAVAVFAEATTEDGLRSTASSMLAILRKERRFNHPRDFDGVQAELRRFMHRHDRAVRRFVDEWGVDDAVEIEGAGR